MARFISLFILVLAMVSLIVLGPFVSCKSPSSTSEANILQPTQGEQPVQAEFEVSALVADPNGAYLGDTVTISASIRNVGGQSGVYEAILAIDGQAVDKRELSLIPQQSSTIEFTAPSLSVGKHKASIGQSEIFVDIFPKLNKIAFVGYYGSYYGFEICTMDSDGTNIVNVTNSGSRDVWPSWSPDGEKIAFGSTREWHNMRSVYVMDADGKNVKCLTPESTDCEFPSWSPDGKKIAYCSSKLATAGREFMALDVFVMNADGSDKIAVTQHGAITSNLCPSWFPDSQRIAYVSNHGGLWEIYSINIDGSDARKYDVCVGQCGMQFPPGNFPIVAVSPDGTSIAFDYLDQFDRGDIYVLSINSGEAKNLTHGYDGNSYYSSWSPDGKRIAFTLGTTDGTGIYIMDADGGNLTKLIGGGFFPVWQR